MNNSDLADKLASETGTSKADARKSIDAVFATIAAAAANGEEISQWFRQVQGQGYPGA
jgi:DNA-binding protein HU-beta